MADRDSRSGVSYADPAVLDYTNRVHAAHDEALERAFTAPDRSDMPAIQVGMSEGRTLELLVRLAGARRIVEVGTLAGYSALRMARAMPADGHIWSIEFDAGHARIARETIEAAGESARVEVIEGAAVDVLPGLEANGPFDLVFIDADKESYDRYGAWAAANLRPGGLLVGDNAFLFGNLLEDSPRAAAMRRFHEQAAVDFESVCVPTPDGLLVGQKK